jgi:hypothetical protein
MGKACRTRGNKRCFETLVRKPEERRAKCGWKENIKMEL